MANPKVAGKLKIFDPAMKAAAAAVMEPQPEPQPQRAPEPSATGARNRKAGGRNVRISGYIPTALEAALRDEVIRRTVEERRTVSFNDVLCDALESWKQAREAAQ
jgi:hypothetical protein